MQQRTLGQTPLTVSNLCLGTMQFGWTADERSSFAVLDAFVAAGGNFIDTADIYSRWVPGNQAVIAEEIIGRWMRTRGNRDSLIIATKVRGADVGGRRRRGSDAEAHRTRGRRQPPAPAGRDDRPLPVPLAGRETPIEETLGAFGELIKAGKVRHIGASNFTRRAAPGGAGRAARRCLPAFETLQPHHNLVHRKRVRGGSSQQLCDDQNIGVIPLQPARRRLPQRQVPAR